MKIQRTSNVNRKRFGPLLNLETWARRGGTKSGRYQRWGRFARALDAATAAQIFRKMITAPPLVGYDSKREQEFFMFDIWHDELVVVSEQGIEALE